MSDGSSTKENLILISCDEDLWKSVSIDFEQVFKKAFDEVCSALGEDPIFEVSVLLTNDQHIQELNRLYRDKDKPTNVLSFPQVDSQELSPGDEPIMLGDIVLSYETISKEAKDVSKTFEDHLIHLFVHGSLHLFGFDHIEEEDASEMETLEVEILSTLNINNPYQEHIHE